MILSLALFLFPLSASPVQDAEDPPPVVEPEAEPEPELAPADTADWAKWERLEGIRLSPDGRWVAHTIRRGDGTRELRLRVVATDATEVFEEGGTPTYSSDGRWAAFAIGKSEAELDELADKKEPAHDDLGLFDLVRGEQSEVEGVASFAFDDSGHYLAFRRYAPKGDDHGADLIVRELESGVDTHFGRVGDYEWSEAGSLLAMTVDAPDQIGNGVRLYDAAGGTLRTLDSAEADYGTLSWREDAADLAAFRERAFEDDEDTTQAVLAWRGLDGERAIETDYDPVDDEVLFTELRVVDFAGLRWSDDGAALYFGLKPWEEKPAELLSSMEKEGDAEGEADDEEEVEEGDEEPVTMRESLDDAPGVEVWHARDIDIIPRQKRTASRDERASHLHVFWLDDELLVQLGDDDATNLDVFEGGRWALARDEAPYEEEQRFSATHFDVYAIDTDTGERRRVLERVKYTYGGDPRGSRFLYVRDDHLWCHDLDSGSSINLTAASETPFISQENSSLTDQKPPYGVEAWTADGSAVLLNSRYDIWSFALDGSSHERLTRGAEESVRHRRAVVGADDEEEYVDPEDTFYVSLYGDTTKQSGFGRLRPGEPLERLSWKDASLGRLMRAEDAEVYAWVEERYDDSPDVFVSGADLDDGAQATETNPFQDDYLWGHSELVDFESSRGDALQGALFYPAGYEPGRQYPMIVYIYELRSQMLHRYQPPSERSPYNTSVFTSQGYFVFQPDIVYRPQNPGLSAVECVVPAVREVLSRGLIDPDRVGLVGHSWGAYQTAFLVTQTDLFAAGVAGAPLTNMMSMSMSIYWNSGQTDAWIFHESQGRMDRPFWQDVDTYIANSPIFNIDRMNTPLLVAFGDEDGAVDWQQGIEMYNAARLAQKQFVMLVYPGENHGLRDRSNQIDYHHRVREWFDHYLNGAEAGPWITQGQSWLDQKRELEAIEERGD